jgi:hypothetical protein
MEVAGTHLTAIPARSLAGIVLAIVMTIPGLSGCDTQRDDSGDPAPEIPAIALEMSVREDGTATSRWAEGIAIAIGAERAAEFIEKQIPLTSAARDWYVVLEAAMPQIEQRAGLVADLFGLPADPATIVVGNRGSSDGFGWVPDKIGINVQAFTEAYGPPGDGAEDRMVRIVAHEYLHLLTYAHYRNHRDLRQTPLDRALWTMFFEGIGDYVSVSSRWFPDEGGAYSPVTAETLGRLEPILVERLEKLVNADSSTERDLRANIAMGKFAEKWGSLPVALWLRSETVRCGETETLRRILELERDGVIPLALRYADPSLRDRLRAVHQQVGRQRISTEPASCLAVRSLH